MWRWRQHGDKLRWRASVALLAGCVLLLSACGARGAVSTMASGAPSVTPLPTPAAPPAGALAWTPVRLPATQPPALAGGFQVQGPTLGVAQSDSATAYVCAAAATDASHTRVSTWVTRDRGATWQSGADITVSIGSPVEVTGCQIIVDSEQAATAVAQVGYLPAGGCIPAVDCVDFVLYLTTDAGRHWTTFKGPQQTLAEMATHGQLTYALFRSPPRSASIPAMTFAVSSDNRRTWKPVPGLASDTANVPGLAGDRVYNFWLNPISGALLVMTSNGYINQQTFLSSADGGASWRTLAAPPFPLETYDLAVQQPFTAQPWRICGGDPASETIRGVQQNKHMDELACTPDGGAHWVTYHLNVPNTLGGSNPDYTLVGIADDGALLLTTPSGLARYADGSSSMQALGPAPNGGLTQYAAGQGVGALWSAPVGGYANPDPQQRIFTASYA